MDGAPPCLIRAARFCAFRNGYVKQVRCIGRNILDEWEILPDGKWRLGDCDAF